MNKLIRLSPTGIEYLDKVWNFTSGCGKGCPYCYAKKITKRFTNHYANEFAPTLYPEALLSPLYLKKPSRIGVCYMGDLFWDCPEFDPDTPVSVTYPNGQEIKNCSLRNVLKDIIQHCPQHTFLFLTKQPQNLARWSPFPENCFVGVTATDQEMWDKAIYYLGYHIEAKVKFISIEPFLGPINTSEVLLFNFDKHENMINQIIIGAQTKPLKRPHPSWVREITEAAIKAGIAVFHKNNLKETGGVLKIISNDDQFKEVYGVDFKQELPKGVGIDH